MIRTRLAELLLAKGVVNKSQLAIELGVNRWGLTRLINNQDTQRIDLQTIEKLCRGLNVMPSELFIILNEDGTEWTPDPTFTMPEKLKTHPRPY